MSDLVEMAKIATTTVVVPLGVFGANWMIRYRFKYTQTAAPDFLLAVLIFDAALVLAFKEFEPFVRSPQLRTLVPYWHTCAFVISGTVWLSIVHWGEPRLARFYESRRARPPKPFPIYTLILCWAAIAALMVLHIGFFVISGAGNG